jgi:hypothetical protein
MFHRPSPNKSRNCLGSLCHHAAARHPYLRVVTHQKCNYARHDRTGRQTFKSAVFTLRPAAFLAALWQFRDGTVDPTAALA